MKGVNGRTRKLITNSIKLIWTACIICNVYKRVKCPYIYHLTKLKLYCQVLLCLYLYGQAISFIISLTLVTGTAKILLEYIKRTEFHQTNRFPLWHDMYGQAISFYNIVNIDGIERVSKCSETCSPWIICCFYESIVKFLRHIK